MNRIRAHTPRGSWSLSAKALTIRFTIGEHDCRLDLPPAAGMRRALPSESEVVFRHRCTTGEFVCYGSREENGVSGVAIFDTNDAANRRLPELFPHRNSLEAAMMFAIANVSFDLACGVCASFPQIDPETVCGFGQLGLSPEYLQAKMTQLPDTSPTGVQALFMNDVEPNYIAALQDARVRDVNWRSILELCREGVKAEFVAELRGLGYTCVFVDELVRLQRIGGDINFVKRNIKGGAALPSLSAMSLLAPGRKRL